MASDLYIPRPTGRRKSWPTHVSKAKNRRVMRKRIAAAAQALRDHEAQKGTA